MACFPIKERIAVPLELRPALSTQQTDFFFTKDVLAESNAKGQRVKSNYGEAHTPLNQLIVEALLGRCEAHQLYMNRVYELTFLCGMI